MEPFVILRKALGRLKKTTLYQMFLKLIPGSLKPVVRRVHRGVNRKQYRLLRAELEEVINRHPNKIMIIFPPSLDWEKQLFQRPQQLAMAFARQGVLVFYIQPLNASFGEDFQEINENLFICRVPVGIFDCLSEPIIYLLTWNSVMAEEFRKPRILYDVVDVLEAFDGNTKKLSDAHSMLLEQAEWVITTSQDLYERLMPLRSDLLLCPNGVAYEHFKTLNRRSRPPDDLTLAISMHQAIVGYFGAFSHWFDYNLMNNLIAMRPDLLFVLIGPDFNNQLLSNLTSAPNVFWLGIKAYSDLPDYVKWFDVAVIPFKLNNITHATSPLKLFEYMAAGKPVVITPMRESMRYEGVLVAETAQEFSDQIDRALVLKDDSQYLSVLDHVARQNTWDSRAQKILDVLQQKKA